MSRARRWTSVTLTEERTHLTGGGESWSIEPLRGTPSVEERVTAQLRDLIVQGRIPQGAKLVQRQIAKEFKVSPTPIRAAWLQLSSEGLLTIDENGHGRVARLSREDFEEVFAARLGVEGLAARLGAQSIDVVGLTRMRDFLEDLEAHAASRDRTAYLKARWFFHATCYDSANRDRLLREVERLYWRAERYNHLMLSDGHRFAESLGHYHRFLKACEHHDGEAAENTIRDSIRWGLDVLHDSLPSERENPGGGQT